MDVIAQRVFNEFVSDLIEGDVFTVYDAMDYIRSRVPKHTPSSNTIGHLARMHPRVIKISIDTRYTLYGVI